MVSVQCQRIVQLARQVTRHRSRWAVACRMVLRAFRGRRGVVQDTWWSPRASVSGGSSDGVPDFSGRRDVALRHGFLSQLRGRYGSTRLRASLEVAEGVLLA